MVRRHPSDIRPPALLFLYAISEGLTGFHRALSFAPRFSCAFPPSRPAELQDVSTQTRHTESPRAADDSVPI